MEGLEEKEKSKMDEVIRKPGPGDIENMIVDWVVNWIIILQEREANHGQKKK